MIKEALWVNGCMGWDGIVIIGPRSYKSTLGANNALPDMVSTLPKTPLAHHRRGEQGSNLLWNATHYLLSIPSYRPGWRTELKISPALWIHKPHTQQIIFMFVMLLWIENMRAMNSQNSHAEQMVLNQMLSWGFYKLWTHHAPEGLCKSLLPGDFLGFHRKYQEKRF